MTDDADDVMRVAAGPLVQVELWQRVLKEAGIRSKVVGTDLTAGLGTAIPDSVELWVHRADYDRAEAAIKQAEEQRGQGEE